MANLALDHEVNFDTADLDESSHAKESSSDLQNRAPVTRQVQPVELPRMESSNNVRSSLRSREAIRIPQINVHAFCESSSVTHIIESASTDRLMSRTNVVLHRGGIEAAIQLYERTTSPNLIILENLSSNEEFLAQLDRLAELCSAGTKVMVIGHVNDVSLYRELTKRGVSEYIPLPLDPVSLINLVANIYRDAGATKVGKLYAFVGARGGVGSSIIAQNVGWMLTRQLGSNVVLADMDLPFGTANLNLDLGESSGVAEAIQDIARLDEVLFERLLTKHSDRFSLLSAPATLDRPYDIDARATSTLLDVAKASVPLMLLDMPHLWTEWAATTLSSVDDVIITATPDIASLRNTKSLVAFLKQARPHDAPPKLVLNKMGAPKRPEVNASEFVKATGLEPTAVIPYDPRLFGTAENEGRMLVDISAKAAGTKAVAQIVHALTAGKASAQKKKSTSLSSLLAGLRRKASGSS